MVGGILSVPTMRRRYPEFSRRGMRGGGSRWWCGQSRRVGRRRRRWEGFCNNRRMKRPFATTVWREGNWYVSQCLELDIASQGETEEDALANLKEALELHF